MITSTTHNINNRNIIVAEGSNVTLKCEATGNGTLTYRWKRISKSLPKNINAKVEQTLTIHNITVNNGGEYYCEVKDGGKNTTSSMRVQVTARSESIIN